MSAPAFTAGPWQRKSDYEPTVIIGNEDRAVTRCDDCRFWSQMVAMAHGGGPVQALCLADGGKLSGKYTSGRQIDCGFKPDLFGKVDDPPNYGEYTRQAYLDEEGPDALSAAKVSA